MNIIVKAEIVDEIFAQAEEINKNAHRWSDDDFAAMLEQLADFTRDAAYEIKEG